MKNALLLFLCFTAMKAIAITHPYYHYKQISIEHGLPTSVTALCGDAEGSLWIGTTLGVYRMKGEKLKKYELPCRLWQQTHRIDRICNGPEQRIWVANSQGLCYYDPLIDSLRLLTYHNEPISSRVVLFDKKQTLIPWRDSLRVYDRNMKLSRSIPLSMKKKLLVSALPFDEERWLVIDETARLKLLNLKDGKFLSSPFPDLPRVYCAFRDKQDRFWISYYGKGVKCYSAQGQLLQEYNTHNSALNNDVVLDIAQWNEAVWMATDGGGVNIVYPDSYGGKIVSDKQSRSYPGNSITSLYPAGGHIWVGTVREGIFCIERSFITTYTRRLDYPQAGLSDKCPLCLWEDTDGTIWIGTDGGGINRLNPQSEQFTHYPATDGEKIVSLCPFASDQLLVSSFTKGLFLFNKRTGSYQPFTLPDSAAQRRIYPSSAPINLRVTPQGEIELYGNTSYRYHPETHRLSPIRPNIPGLYSSWIYIGEYRSQSFFNDRCNIFAYNKEKQQYEFLDYNPGGQLLAAAMDSVGNLWTATVNGVTYTSLASGHTKKLRLPGKKDIITSMVVDKKGTIWMGSSGGVYAYDAQKQSFVLYNEMDGVLPNDFLPKPVLVSKDGNVYMGGSEGLMRLNMALKPASSPPVISLLLQEVVLDGRRIPVGADRQVSIPYDFSSLQVWTFIEGGNMLRKRIYRFRIKGMTQGYVETSSPYYTLLTLAPGDYTLTAQCTQKGGGWSNEFPLLHFTVLPPWWLQDWCLVLYSLFSICLIVYIAYLYDRRVQHKYSEQECAIYKEKVRALININHELRTPLTLIYAPLKQLADNKLIPYELRTKLYGVLKQTFRMRNIIDMILHMRKMEVEKNTLRMSAANFNEWLQGIIDGFKDEFALRQIGLEVNFDPRVGYMYFDLNQCEIVLNNLLGNACKFSEAGTAVTVSTRLDENSNMIYVSVQDQGIGLQQEDFNHLFNRFYQGKHYLHGTGIGLSYSKLLVEMHGGIIGAKNNPDRGASFFFTLPYRQEAADIETISKDYLNVFDTQLPPEPGKKAALLPSVSGVKDSEKFHSILLVEDDRDLCDYLTCNLQASFEHVYEAHDGLEALPLLTSHLPQIVLSDIKMPRMDGLELCRRMKQKAELNYIPMVLLTSCVDDAVMEEAYKIGAEAYITKPFDMDLLLVQLQNILNNHNVVKKHYAPVTMALSADKEMDYPDEQFSFQLNRIIREHIDNTELDAVFIASQLGMSRATLYNKTKNILQGGISGYITKCRLELATRLLSTTMCPIIEITEKTGFKHARNFSTLFKNCYGMSPTEYRKKHYVSSAFPAADVGEGG